MTQDLYNDHASDFNSDYDFFAHFEHFHPQSWPTDRTSLKMALKIKILTSNKVYIFGKLGSCAHGS